MTTGLIRQTLQAATRDLHERLDAAVGEFGDLHSYRRYLRGTDSFRRSVEPALGNAGDWPIVPLAAALAQDLGDLGVTPGPSLTAPLLSTPSARAGALYVLEGSSLGARVLARRAAALGLSEAHGARHLALQTADNRRWRAFLDWLETGSFDATAASDAARITFTLAQKAFGGTDTPQQDDQPSGLVTSAPAPHDPAPDREIA